MRADRLLALVMLLRHHGRMTAAALAAELEVSQRTVLRDIDALSVSGVPVYADRGRNGGFALLPGYRTDLTGLTLDEARALLSSGAGRLTSPAFVSAMRKVAAAIPDSHRDEVKLAARRILVRPEGFVAEAPASQPLAQLQESVFLGRRIRLQYKRFGAESVERTLDPVGLIMGGDTWYLVARRDGTERMYRVSRMSDVTVLDEPADRPDDVDLEHIWQERRSEFRGRFVPSKVAVRVRADRYDDLTRMRFDVLDVGPVTDGWRSVRMTCADLRYALGALWSMADAVVVNSPGEVADEIRRRTRAMTGASR